MKHDIFICHASEDKASVARPLATCLSDRDLSYWIDEAEITAGDSITEKVNEGIRASDFVVVILSRAFMAKHWPKKELWAVLDIEAKSDRTIIIPVLVGTQTEVDGIIEEFPLLNDKLFLLWNGDANRVANAIQRTILKTNGQSAEPEVEMHACGHCATPFQHGVHVCLGCQGTIKYGLTPQERLQVRQTAAGAFGLLSLVTMVLLPSYSESWLGIKIPMMWGIGFWSLPIAGILALVVGFYAEARTSACKAHLIRTYR
ncbi:MULTISPECIES: toll/interleukin-1 receptor domain-containing protein [unclassified Shewanella]|uniref:toll/interleukin-1 receptor domain-containing protein n=1 Tax=unclassified Shewanella TaxID=196818 RepID=UPI0022BA594C|nr:MULTISPECIES: toll/interleukin-1 receptor domain-containing protein [unclassified Shewanella]MEC4739049.1 toll/interleukin-1 receptor domain-containing protein [Shewanella sp. E94]WBJ95906.1 toll/interleukin-1 receptor domain-containing protein [Shewanella sp. MTB7]